MEKENVKGDRKCNRVTFNSASAKMGDKLYVTIPKLDNSLSIVPNTTNLIYNLKISNDKSWPQNNMGRLFVQGLQIKIGRDIVYENTAENVFRIYEDLWLPVEKRYSLVSHGITSVETRKSLSGTSGASDSSTTNGILDKDLASVMKNQRIRLGQVLDDHGLHSPSAGQEVKYTLTLPDNSVNVGDKLSNQTVGNFSLENLELEYDTISNEEAVEHNRSAMNSGKSYIIKHVSLETLSEWNKDSTLVNENIQISRQSLKAIVFLFKWNDQVLDESYIYPNITEVFCNVNGKHNVIHANPMLVDKFEQEAKRLFGKGQDNISTGKFYSTAFSVVLDFRGMGKDMKYGDGIKVDGTSGIQVTFKRKATAKNVKCYTQRFHIAGNFLFAGNFTEKRKFSG